MIIIQVASIYVANSFVSCVLGPWAQFGGGHGGRVPPTFQRGGT